MEKNEVKLPDLLELDKKPKRIYHPSNNPLDSKTRRGFFMVEDIEVVCDQALLVMDFITTEDSLAPRDLASGEFTTNRTGNRRMLDQLDRLRKFNSDIISHIIEITKANPSKKGVAVLSHGGASMNWDPPAPFTVSISKIAMGGKSYAMAVEELVVDLQQPETYSYILLLACNPAEYMLDPLSTKIPLAYYQSVNDHTGSEGSRPVMIGL